MIYYKKNLMLLMIISVIVVVIDVFKENLIFREKVERKIKV